MSERVSFLNNLSPGLSTSLSTDYQPKPVEKVESISKIKETESEKQEQSQQQRHTKEQTEKVIRSLNEFVKASNSHLKFEFHDGLQEYYVTLVDDQTNEVIKEIPSKRLMDVYAEMTEFLGLLVDRKA